MKKHYRSYIKQSLATSGLINSEEFLTKADLQSVTRCYYDLFQYDFESNIKTLVHETLIIYGTKDTFMHRTKSTELYGDFPKKSIKTFPSNHSIPSQFPKEVADYIQLFIKPS
jgi:pimeloyl-ACP methyl ester carboxylesterase